MSSAQGWIVVSDQGNRVECSGVASEIDSGRIALAMKESGKSAGKLRINNYTVMAKIEEDRLVAVYYNQQ